MDGCDDASPRAVRGGEVHAPGAAPTGDGDDTSLTRYADAPGAAASTAANSPRG
eukprot:gene44394-64693_t